jgi:hypothetical protein
MDGLKVWFKRRAKFNGENNVLLQTMQYLKHLDKPFSPGMTGGILGYIDQIIHILNKLEVVDPDCIHHVRYNYQQKMSLILRHCSDIKPYSRITYDYYMKMAATGKYDVDQYMDEITRLCQKLDPQNVNLNPVRTYNVDIEPTAVHANYTANYHPTVLRSKLKLLRFNIQAIVTFFSLRNPSSIMKTHHVELHNRLRAIRVEVVAALVPIRGPPPTSIIKMLSELKNSTPRSDVPYASPIQKAPIAHASGLPEQYPPQ